MSTPLCCGACLPVVNGVDQQLRYVPAVSVSADAGVYPRLDMHEISSMAEDDPYRVRQAEFWATVQLGQRWLPRVSFTLTVAIISEDQLFWFLHACCCSL